MVQCKYCDAVANAIASVSGLDSSEAAVDPVAALAASVDANTSAILPIDLQGTTATAGMLVSVLEQNEQTRFS